MPNQPIQTLNYFLETLKAKWREVPGTTQNRVFSADLLSMAAPDFIDTWQRYYNNNCTGDGYSVRGWYHDLYTDLARREGKWLEVGSGLGYDGTYFARMGAHVTFLDIVPDNLKVIERVCELSGIKNVEFVHLRSLEDISHLGMFNTILAIGSLINAPFEMMCEERAMLANHLHSDGRWLELCYPEARWIREGALPFTEWGSKTDGEGTPWIEWYDTKKLIQSLQPHRFDVIANFNFHNDDFNWFDLIKRN